MVVDELQRNFFEYANSLLHEGFLDSQFGQLQLLQDESNPDFVVEVLTLFFKDSERLINDIYKALDQQTVDFKKIDAHVHQLKGSSSSIGAQRISNACVVFRNFCDEQNVKECLRCLHTVKHEYLLVKTKIERLLQLERQITAAGGMVPTLTNLL